MVNFRHANPVFSFFCLLWNVLTFLQTLYIGRMLYEINATTLYELPAEPLWIMWYNVVLGLDLMLAVVYHLKFVHSAAGVRAEALRTVDLVTIGEFPESFLPPQVRYSCSQLPHH